jgi:AbrB family looped-hinge helix DNA binding protein
MATATVTSKGQITLPKEIRKALGLGAGDVVDFVESDGGFRLVPMRKDIRDLKGHFAGRVERPVSLEDMQEAIECAAADLDPP